MAGQPLHSRQFTRRVRDMIAFGEVNGWSCFTRFGHNGDLGSTIEDVWSNGGVYSFPTTASTLEVLSDDVNDTSAGSGARSITIQGLDADWAEQEETIALNGTTPAVSTLTYIRLNRAFIATTGTYGIGSAGDVTVRISGAGATQCLIRETSEAGDAWDYGQTLLGRYSVPAGKVAFVDHIQVSVESNKRADFTLYQRAGGDTVAAPFTAKRVFKTWEGINRSTNLDFPAPVMFSEKTDIIVRAVLSNGVNGNVTISYTLFLGPA